MVGRLSSVSCLPGLVVMASDCKDPIDRALLHRPHVRLMGSVDVPMLETLLDALDQAEDDGGELALEISTLGGDAEIARRMVLELDLARRRLPSRRFLFIGKTTIYSAGVTVMSAFPQPDRFVTADASFLIHCRQLDKRIEISGPLRGSLPKVEALHEQLEIGVQLEDHGFARLIEGTAISLDEIRHRALHNWYLTADEAIERKLVAGVIEP